MNPTILGVIGPGFLNQAPTLRFKDMTSQSSVVVAMLDTQAEARGGAANGTCHGRFRVQGFGFRVCGLDSKDSKAQ